jgi:general stress protein 26
MKDKSLLKVFKDIIETCGFVNLATVNPDGYPETRAMLNLRNPEMFPKMQKLFTDDFTFYFTTNTSSEKFKQISANKKASVYFVKESSFGGLLFTGTIEIVDDKKTKRSFWQDGWTMYYKGGAEDPDYTLLKFCPKTYKYYNGQFEVLSGEMSRFAAKLGSSEVQQLGKPLCGRSSEAQQLGSSAKTERQNLELQSEKLKVEIRRCVCALRTC